MLTLEQYFNQLPKKYVHQFYKQIQPDSGITQGSQVLQSVLSWTQDEKRLKESLENMGDMERLLLAAIYGASSRGLQEGELHTLVKHLESESLAESIHKLEKELWIFARKAQNISFHGFQDLQKTLLSHLFQREELPQEQPEGQISYQNFLRSHLLHFMALINKESLKITQKGELHRKYIQRLSQAFCYSEALSDAIADEEILFLFQFLVDQKWVQEADGTLILTSKGLEACEWSSERHDQALFQWWHQNRFARDKGLLQEASQNQHTVWPIQTLCHYFWSISGALSQFIKIGTFYPDYKEGLTWEQLPHSIREMWLLGLIHLSTYKGKIQVAQWNTKLLTASLEGSFPETPNSYHPISLPNFEVLLPPESPSDLRYAVEMIGQKTSDENMTHYALNKESLIRGFQGGLTSEMFHTAISKLALSPENQTVLEDWASCYLSGTFIDVLILKINHAQKFQELQDIPQLKELISEVIPNYGFIIPRHNKQEVQKFLEQFGLFPGDTTLVTPTASEQYIKPSQPYPISQVITTGELVPYDSGTYKVTSKKNQPKVSEIKVPDLAEKIEILAEALELKKKVELSFVEKNRQRVLIRPIHLIKTSPATAIAIEVQSGHRGQYNIEEVTSLRVVE